jgi:hypothetical protein
MAAELAADLDEGSSPEEVLGSDATDARAFAAAWARERGVIPRRTRNPRVIVPIVAAALTLVAIAGAVLMASSGKTSQAVEVGPRFEPIRDPLLPPKSVRVRVYAGPPFHVSYVTTPVFTERAINVTWSPAASERRPECVDAVDFTATPCVWPAPAKEVAIDSSGVDWPRVGLGMTLFGGIGLILVVSGWLWSRAGRSHHAMP